MNADLTSKCRFFGLSSHSLVFISFSIRVCFRLVMSSNGQVLFWAIIVAGPFNFSLCYFPLVCLVAFWYGLLQLFKPSNRLDG